MLRARITAGILIGSAGMLWSMFYVPPRYALTDVLLSCALGLVIIWLP